MNQELVYTSAPRGLKPGSRGFCTVASSAGMAKNLADLLESLSPYRHIHPPNSEQSRLNPVNFSYVVTRMGGKQMRVVSRVADAGLDYSNRSNKLAHHVVVEQTQYPVGGPAWLLSQPGFVFDNWSGEPRQLSNRDLPDGNPPTVACEYWRTITGDAGWAGELARSFAQGKSAYIVFAPGTDVLRLFREAQLLLPVAQRWECTFSTYFTKLPPNVECSWRAVVSGGPESGLAKRAHDAFVIDLSNPAGSPGDNEYVTAARSGRIVEAAVGSKLTPPTEPVVPALATQSDAPRSTDVPVSVEPSLTLAPPDIPKARRRTGKRTLKSSRERIAPRELAEQGHDNRGVRISWIATFLLIVATAIITSASWFAFFNLNKQPNRESLAMVSNAEEMMDQAKALMEVALDAKKDAKNLKEATEIEAKKSSKEMDKAKELMAKASQAQAQAEALMAEALIAKAEALMPRPLQPTKTLSGSPVSRKSVRSKNSIVDRTDNFKLDDPIKTIHNNGPYKEQSLARFKAQVPDEKKLSIVSPENTFEIVGEPMKNGFWTIRSQESPLANMRLNDKNEFTFQWAEEINSLGSNVGLVSELFKKMNVSIVQINDEHIQLYKETPSPALGPHAKFIERAQDYGPMTITIDDLPSSVVLDFDIRDSGLPLIKGVELRRVLNESCPNFALVIKSGSGYSQVDKKLNIFPEKNQIGNIKFRSEIVGTAHKISCEYEFSNESSWKAALTKRTVDEMTELTNEIDKLKQEIEDAGSEKRQEELEKEKDEKKERRSELEKEMNQFNNEIKEIYQNILDAKFHGLVVGKFENNDDGEFIVARFGKDE